MVQPVQLAYFDEEKELMFCRCCVEAKLSGTSFVEGNGTFKVDTIKKHECSTTHQKALRIKAAKNRPAEESHIGQGLYRERCMANSKYRITPHTIRTFIHHNTYVKEGVRVINRYINRTFLH